MHVSLQVVVESATVCGDRRVPVFCVQRHMRPLVMWNQNHSSFICCLCHHTNNTFEEVMWTTRRNPWNMCDYSCDCTPMKELPLYLRPPLHPPPQTRVDPDCKRWRWMELTDDTANSAMNLLNEFQRNFVLVMQIKFYCEIVTLPRTGPL